MGFRQELGQPRQIVGRSREGESPSDAIASPKFGLRLPAHRLGPAEAFLDALAQPLADCVARLAATLLGTAVLTAT
jgi:hypothetical protein